MSSTNDPKPILTVLSNQLIAQCPLCGGELSRENPPLKGDQAREMEGANGLSLALAFGDDPRPKCPHCYGRFDIQIVFENGLIPDSKGRPKFELHRFNDLRAVRGVEAAEVKVTWPDGEEDYLWMSESDINANIKEWGPCDGLREALKAYQ